MPRKTKTLTIKKTAAPRKVKKTVKAKPVKAAKAAKKTAVDKINATVAKWDMDSTARPDYIKLGTSDFLDLLATSLEKGKGINYCEAPCGPLSVLPKKPKELLNTVKYLRRMSVKK